MFAEDVTFAADLLKPLVGYKILATTITPDSSSYGFVVEKGKSRKTCWVDCDPEGNGPGWLQIEDQDYE